MPSIEHNVPLAPLTTLGLGGPASHFIRATDAQAVAKALAWAQQRDLRHWVLGGGSNVVIADQGLDGLVIQPHNRGLQMTPLGAVSHVTIAAGEPWDSVVAATTAAGLSGIECLSGIPGLAGATPIQNVGAYGQELGGVLRSIRAFDREQNEVVELSAAECALTYRSSAMRRDPQRWVVLELVLELACGGTPKIRYAELARALHGGPVNPARVRSTVLTLRRAKSMVIDAGDVNRRSAGSFFTNPIVAPEVAADVRAQATTHPREFPSWVQPDGRVKLAAGWLIEAAGFRKGDRAGAVGISSAHALALVHHGDGTTRELVSFARRIRDGVCHRFGVALVPEPVMLGLEF